MKSFCEKKEVMKINWLREIYITQIEIERKRERERERKKMKKRERETDFDS